MEGDAPAGRLMVIFSLGGLLPASHGRGGAVRCRTGLVPLDGEPRVELRDWPSEGSRGVVTGTRAWVERDGAEVRGGPVAVRGGVGRWGDIELLAFAGTTLWTWLGLPLALAAGRLPAAEAGAGRVAVTVPEGWPGAGGRHVLHFDGDGRVDVDEEGPTVHHLSGFCDFGDAVVPTRRRTTRAGGRVPILWADVIAAHLLAPPGLKETGRPADTGRQV